jgi:hypothetical protein
VTEIDDRPIHPYERMLNIALAVFCWASAAIVIGFEATTVLPLVAHEHVPMDMKVCDLVGVGGIAVLAGYTLLLEWIDRHHQGRRRFWRRTGWTRQGILLILCVGDALQKHEYLALPWIASAVVMGLGSWNLWMREQMLPAEDQKVIDELIADKERREAEAIRAAVHRRREAKFRKIAAQYQPAGAKPVGIPALKPKTELNPWPIPEGKHRPVVYFVQNGDRVKIGTTTNLRSRISALSLRPTDIVLLVNGGRPFEQALHKRFATLRVGNTEWFANSGPVAEYIVIEAARARATAKAEG